MLSRHTKGAGKPIWYLAGPTKMVASMRNLLIERGVAVEDIRSEEFYGY